jgi:Domain of unknown function (DUF4793)
MITLLALSSIQHMYVLNEGESRQIFQQSPILLTTDLMVTGAGDPGTQVSIYNVPSHCPRLNGPQVISEDTRTISLQVDDYQYDYFYLNAGSYIFVDALATRGAVNFYIIRGEQVLARLEGDSSEDESDFGRIAARQRFLTQNDRQPSSESYHVPKSDIYILLYDNASTGPTQLQVHFKLVLSTYNLAGRMPTCQIRSLQDQCHIHYRSIHHNCVIAQVSRPSGVFSEKVVHLDVQHRRNWMLILFLSALPILWPILQVILQNRSTPYERVPEAYGFSPDLPPATAPESTDTTAEEPSLRPAKPVSLYPSAPLGNDGEIYVAPESVIVLPSEDGGVTNKTAKGYGQYPIASVVEPLPVPMRPHAR